MNQHEQKLRKFLWDADMKTAEQIGMEFPAADDAAKERVMQGILERMHTQSAADTVEDTAVPVIARSHWRGILSAAACLLICVGVIGGFTLHRPIETMENPEPASEVSVIPEETRVSQTAKETDVSLKIQPETTVVQSAEPTIVTVPEAAQTVVTVTQAVVTEPIQETSAAETIVTVVTETVPLETQMVPETLTFLSMAEQTPAVPGYKVTLSENEFNLTCAIWPEHAAEGKAKIETVYAPADVPQGWTLDTEKLAVMEQNYAEMEETYLYEHWYRPSGNDPVTDSFLILTQKRLHADGVELPFVEGESACYLTRKKQYILSASGKMPPEDRYDYDYAVTEVNGRSAYLYRAYWAHDPDTDGLHQTEYTLFWEQDGYLFSLYTADVPESYLPELIRFAESVQMIG